MNQNKGEAQDTSENFYFHLRWWESGKKKFEYIFHAGKTAIV